jgi:hypothetical protein
MGSSALQPEFRRATPLCDYADTLSWSRGRHALKFGDYRRASSNPDITAEQVLFRTSRVVLPRDWPASWEHRLRYFRQSVTNFCKPRGRAARPVVLSECIHSSAFSFIGSTTPMFKTERGKIWRRVARNIAILAQASGPCFGKRLESDRNVTLSLGLRYDYFGLRTSGRAHFGRCRPGADCLGLAAGQRRSLRPLVAPRKHVSDRIRNQPPITAARKMRKCALCFNLDPASDANQFVGPEYPNPDKVVIPVDRNNFGRLSGSRGRFPSLEKENGYPRRISGDLHRHPRFKFVGHLAGVGARQYARGNASHGRKSACIDNPRSISQIWQGGSRAAPERPGPPPDLWTWCAFSRLTRTDALHPERHFASDAELMRNMTLTLSMSVMAGLKTPST